MKKRRLFLKSFFFMFLVCFLPSSAKAVEYTGKGFRDPFSEFQSSSAAVSTAKKPVSVEEGLSAMTLQGVVLTQHKAQALIDGQMLEIGGDTAFGKVMAITKDGVTIAHNGKEYLLERKKGEGMGYGPDKAV